MATIVVGLVWGMRQTERHDRAAARPHLPGDPERLPREPPELVGPDHARVARELQAGLNHPGTYLVTGPVGSGKSAVCAKVINSATARRRFFHSPEGGQAEDRRFWADLSGRRPGSEVEDAIVSAVGAESLTAALDVLRDDAATLLVLNDADEAFAWTGDDPLLRRLAAGRGGLRLVVTARGEPRPSGLTWSLTLRTAALPMESSRQLFIQLAPALRDHPAVDQLLAQCDGLPLAVSIVGRVVASAKNADDVAKLASRALQGAGDPPGGKTMRFAIEVAEAALEAEERDAWWALSQFPGGLSRDDLRPVLGMPLAEYHIAHLYLLGLVARAGAGLRVPVPLRLSAPASGEEPFSVGQRFVERGLDVVRNDKRAGLWLARHALNLVALVEFSKLPTGSLELACEGLEVDRDIRRSDLAENALVRLVTVTLVDRLGAARVTAATEVLCDRYRYTAASQLLDLIVAVQKAAGDHPATAKALLSAGDVARMRGRYDDAEGLLAQAQGIYDEIGERVGGANARKGRGEVALQRDRLDDAEGLLAQAQGIYDEIGERVGGANARKNRGDVALQRGRLDDAEGLFAQAQGIYDEIGERVGGANARRSRGDVALQRGRLDDAEGLFAQAQGIYDEIGDRLGGTNTRESRGHVALQRGRLDDAEGLFAEAQGISDDIGDRVGGANARVGRGHVALRRGRLDGAEGLFAEAQGIYDEIGDRLGGANARRSCGDVALRRGRLDDAEGLFAEAQGISDGIGDRVGGAHARKSRGHVALSMVKAGKAPPEHLGAARQWFLEAESLYGEIGHLARQGRALVGAARCSVGHDRTALATRAAACLERSGQLVEARALEDEFGVVVSIGVALHSESGQRRLSREGPGGDPEGRPQR